MLRRGGNRPHGGGKLACRGGNHGQDGGNASAYAKFGSFALNRGKFKG